MNESAQGRDEAALSLLPADPVKPDLRPEI